MSSSPVQIVIVGAGPRAVGILDRIGAHERMIPAQGLRVDLVDPHVPGAGRIWDAHGSSLLLMNSRATDVTMFTDDSCSIEGPVTSGPSLAEWAEGVRDGSIPPPTQGTDRLAEVKDLRPTDFASRRVQALYLEWVFGVVRSRLPERVQLHVHRHSAVGLTRTADGDRGRSWEVTLDSGMVLHADELLATVGHTDADLTPGQKGLAGFAGRHGAVYTPPAQANDVDLAAIPAGEDAIVRGMGLGAVDLLALLTEGRGGRFIADPRPGEVDRLRYEPSGEEPVLHLGSRRGTPYHAKVRDEGDPAGPRDLVHLTPEAIEEASGPDGLVDFDGDVVPLIAAEIQRAVPSLPVADGSGWELLSALDDPLERFVGTADDASGHEAGHDPAARTREELVSYIREDLQARRGQDNAEARALFQVLLRITGALATLLPSSRLTPASRAAYPAVWHSLFSFVCSGPPPHRLHQILALERAGVLHFLGPRLHVEADERTGAFRAHAAGGVELETRVLIDAFLPPSTILGSRDPFLRALGGSFGADSPDAPGRLHTGPEGRVLDTRGAPLPNVWAAGPGTSEIPLGAFSRPGTNAPVFRMNDVLARDLLSAAGALSARDDDQHSLPSARFGVIGAGKIGTAIARQAVRSGLEVTVHSRKDPRAVLRHVPAAEAPSADRPAPGPASTGPVSTGPVTPDIGTPEPSVAPQLLVLALPFHAVFTLDPHEWSGTVIIDATNPWGERDQDALHHARAIHGPDLSSSELVAAHLTGSQVVKALNHIGYHDLEDHARPGGGDERRALAIAGDDPGARDLAARLVDRLGFDPVLVDGLAQARHLEPDGPVFAVPSTRAGLTDALRDARAEVVVAA